MSRGLSPVALSAVTSEVASFAMAVELDFPSGFARYNSTTANFNLFDQTYFGLGVLGAIGTIQEGSEVQSYGTTVQVSGIPRDLVAVTLGQAYQGRAATIYLVHLDTTSWTPVAATKVFRGRMDQMDIVLGDTATITVRLEDRLVAWDRAHVRRYTDEDHQRRHPGDKFFSFVSAASEKRLQWPAR